MHAFARDSRFAFRQLWKAPGFSGTVILTLALGIGATTAIFSLVEGILLRPLPFSNPDRLVLLGDHLGEGPGISVTAREIGTYANATSAFAALGGSITASYEISGGVVPEELNAARFTAGVFPTLGVEPMLGRVFTQQEEDTHQPLAVISYALWQNRYHLDPAVLGSSIALDRRPYTIIGVMPRSFEFPIEDGRLNQAQLWIPMSLTAEELSEEHAGFWGYQMVARLKDGVTVPQAAQDADRVAKQIMRNLPTAQSAIAIRGDVTPLMEYSVAETRPLLRTLFSAVSLVLLIGCFNVAGLMLVRAIRRRSEYAVRLALGAPSRVIVRESVLEGLVLGAIGGLLGLAFAAIAIRIALQLLPESMPRVDSISIDATVSGFATILALITGTICGLAPAFTALRTNVAESLKEGARTGTGASNQAWLRSGLVVSEIAIALVLLIVAGAFLRSLQRMEAVDPGFRPDHVLVAGYRLPLQQYSTEASSDAFQRAVVDRLSGKPGVVAVGITSAVPAAGGFGETAFTIEGEPTADWKLKFAIFATTYGDYFRAMGIPLVDGRYFTEDDRSGSPLVIIINQSMANHCWPGQRAIGKRMHVGSPKNVLPWVTVVGVVADTKMGSRDEPSDDQWYTPAEQPAALNGTDYDGKLTAAAGAFITLRSALPPRQVIQTLRAAVAEVDPLLALQQVQAM